LISRLQHTHAHACRTAFISLVDAPMIATAILISSQLVYIVPSTLLLLATDSRFVLSEHTLRVCGLVDLPWLADGPWCEVGPGPPPKPAPPPPPPPTPKPGNFTPTPLSNCTYIPGTWVSPMSQRYVEGAPTKEACCKACGLSETCVAAVLRCPLPSGSGSCMCNLKLWDGSNILQKDGKEHTHTDLTCLTGRQNISSGGPDDDGGGGLSEEQLLNWWPGQ
jgi:hypothetical protein